MKKINLTCFGLFLTIVFLYATNINAQGYSIYDGTLTEGYDIGVNTSDGLTNWIENEGTHIKMEYPPNQSWGAVFITWGTPVPPGNRPFQNFSGYITLSVDLKGEEGGETVEIGIKDNLDPDNGSETKISVHLTAEWRTYEFLLNRFNTADLKHLYVVTEFVFSGRTSKTVYFRNVKFSR